MTIQIPDDLARGLERLARQARPKLFCEPFAACLIPAPRR